MTVTHPSVRCGVGRRRDSVCSRAALTAEPVVPGMVKCRVSALEHATRLTIRPFAAVSSPARLRAGARTDGGRP